MRLQQVLSPLNLIFGDVKSITAVRLTPHLTIMYDATTVIVHCWRFVQYSALLMVHGRTNIMQDGGALSVFGDIKLTLHTCDISNNRAQVCNSLCKFDGAHTHGVKVTCAYAQGKGGAIMMKGGKGGGELLQARFVDCSLTDNLAEVHSGAEGCKFSLTSLTKGCNFQASIACC